MARRAAIDVLSNDPAMPPTLSGHNQYWLWGPRDYDGTALIDVGGDLSDDQKLCTSATLLGQFHAPYIMPFEDMDIILCLGYASRSGSFGQGLNISINGTLYRFALISMHPKIRRGGLQPAFFQDGPIVCG